MTTLPPTFELDHYGIHCRLVNEGDAEFITALRSDAKLGRFIHASDGDVQKQVEWIKEYKKREKKGLDYYFIFFFNDNPIGVIRVYDIDHIQSKGTIGSWLCIHGCPIEQVMATILIGREFLFGELGLLHDYFNVRKGNKKVQRMHDMFGAKVIEEDELNYYYVLERDDFEKHKIELLELLNLK